MIIIATIATYIVGTGLVLVALLFTAGTLKNIYDESGPLMTAISSVFFLALFVLLGLGVANGAFN